MRWRHLAVALVAASALVGTGAVFLFPKGRAVDKADSPGDDPRGKEAAFVVLPCEADLLRLIERPVFDRRAVCAKMKVPLTPAAKRTIELGVFRLIPRKPTSRAPVLLLAGGPGDSFSPHLDKRLTYLLPLARDREILIIDQRGTGAGRPILDCEKKLREKEDLARCFDEWNKDLDVAAFSTENSVRDIAAVLAALEMQRIAIVSVSYGTRLASAFAEKYPEKVEALVLDSPMPRTIDLLASVGENAVESIGKVLESCSEQPTCAAMSPSTLDELVDLLSRLDQAPGAGKYDGKEFISTVSQLSVSPGALRLVPLVLSEAKEGRFETLETLKRGFSEYQFSFGMHLSIQCSEVVPLHRDGSTPAPAEKTRARLGELLSAAPYDEYCGAWRVPSLPPPTSEAKVDVPTLALHGQFDPVAPRAYAEKITENIPAARVVTVPNVSHGAALTSCGVLVVDQFLASYAEKEPPELPSCTSQSTPLTFEMNDPDPASIGEVVHQIRYRL